MKIKMQKKVGTYQLHEVYDVNEEEAQSLIDGGLASSEEPTDVVEEASKSILDAVKKELDTFKKENEKSIAQVIKASAPSRPAEVKDRSDWSLSEFVHGVANFGNSHDATQKWANKYYEKASTMTVTTDGDALVPEILLDKIFAAANPATPVWSNALKIQMASETVKFPATVQTGIPASGKSAYSSFLAIATKTEGSDAGQTNPETDAVTFEAKTQSAYIDYSLELKEGSVVNIDDYLAQQLGFAMANRLEWMALNDTVAFDGLTECDAAISLTRTTSGTIKYQDVHNMYSHMIASGQQNGIWVVAGGSVLATLLGLTTGTNGYPLVQPNLAGPAPLTLMGRPLYVSPVGLPYALGKKGDLAFVDPTTVCIGERRGVSISYSRPENGGLGYLSDKHYIKINWRGDFNNLLLNPIQIVAASSGVTADYVSNVVLLAT